jgi:plastocyanin
LLLPILGSLSSCGSAAATPPAVKTVYVDIVDQRGDNPFAFRPASVTVRVNTRVVWRNRSSQPHTVTAKGQRPAFDSGTRKLIGRHHLWAFLFRRPGTYHYYCLLHPFMTGTIVVRT